MISFLQTQKNKILGQNLYTSCMYNIQGHKRLHGQIKNK